MPERNYRKFISKQEAIERAIAELHEVRREGETLAQWLRRPDIRFTDVYNNSSLSPEAIQQVEITLKYAGYIARQENEVARFKELEHKQIPSEFDYATVPSLRLEARQKLDRIRPATIGQASRISGVSPADLSILLVWLKRSASEANLTCGGVPEEAPEIEGP